MAGYYRIEISHRREVGELTSRGDAIPSFVAGAGRAWSDTPVIPIGNHGCVIGHLFSRSDSSVRIAELDADQVLAIQASGGRSLLDDFWGAYVAVLKGANGSVSVLRDPSAQMPCYYRSEADCLTLTSDVTQLARRGPQAVNFIEIGRLLASVDAIGRETCISGVMELLPGECITTTPEGYTISEWWSPWPWTAPERQVSFEANASRLRRALQDCVGSWASCFRSMVLGVSGGLDSSIVACAAHSQELELHCLNIVSSGAGGDERRYASVLASALGRTLQERHYSLSSIDIEKPVAPHHAWPNAPYFMLGIAAIHSGFSSEHHIDAYFSGNGGDNVFCSLNTAAPFVDRFLTQGSRSGVMTTLRDLSVLTGADGMAILRQAWGIYKRVGGPPRIYRNTLGLSASFIEALEPFQPLHPWLENTKGALPGKIAHVKQIMRAHRGIELYPRAESPIHIAP
ncbi:MAG: asparagine synthase-related protein, partial [Blastomonas fulva]